MHWHYGCDNTPAYRLSSAQVRSVTDVQQMLEHVSLMNDHCISANLRSAGLGSMSRKEERASYGFLNPNALVESTDQSMLMTAINRLPDYNKKCRVISVLLLYGADINEVDEHGRTALMLCAVLALDKVASWLHLRTIDPFILDNDGNTTLHYTACYGRIRILKAYLKMLRKQHMYKYIDTSADPFEKTNHAGLTAVQTALAKGHVQCAEVIEQERNRMMIKASNKKKGRIIRQSRSTDQIRHNIRATHKLLSHRTQSFDTLNLLDEHDEHEHITEQDRQQSSIKKLPQCDNPDEDLLGIDMLDRSSQSSSVLHHIVASGGVPVVPGLGGKSDLSPLRPLPSLPYAPRLHTGEFSSMPSHSSHTVSTVSMRDRLHFLLYRRNTDTDTRPLIKTASSFTLTGTNGSRNNRSNAYSSQLNALDVRSRPSTSFTESSDGRLQDKVMHNLLAQPLDQQHHPQRGGTLPPVMNRPVSSKPRRSSGSNKNCD